MLRCALIVVRQPGFHIGLSVSLCPPDYPHALRMTLPTVLVVFVWHAQRWMMEVYEIPGVKEASNIDHCKKGYFGRTGNNIVPLGPHLNYSFAY